MTSLRSMSVNFKDDEITSVLIGASRPSQIEDCVRCIENTHFSEEELKRIDEISLEK